MVVSRGFSGTEPGDRASPSDVSQPSGTPALLIRISAVRIVIASIMHRHISRIIACGPERDPTAALRHSRIPHHRQPDTPSWPSTPPAPPGTPSKAPPACVFSVHRPALFSSSWIHSLSLASTMTASPPPPTSDGSPGLIGVLQPPPPPHNHNNSHQIPSTSTK